MTSTDSRLARTLRIAAVVTAGVIVYGSLFPFDVDRAHAAQAWFDGMPLGWERPSRGDLIANLLLYAPLGALLARLFGGPRPWLAAALLATLACTAMSVGVELAQTLFPERTPSLVDVLLNAASGALGGGVAIVWGRTASGTGVRRFAFVAWLRERPDPVAVTVLALWLAAHTAPFVPHADLRTAWHALAPLREFATSSQGLLKYCAGFLLLGTVVRATFRRERFWQAWFLIAAASIACRVVFVKQNLGPNEPLALLLALPMLAVLRGLRTERTAHFVLAASGLAWLAAGLAPFEFADTARAFDWRPFAGFLTGDVEHGYLAFLEKASFYLGWAWLAAFAGMPRWRAIGLGVAALTAVEIAQCFVVGRVGEITDPLLFAILAGTATSRGLAPRPGRPRASASRERAHRAPDTGAPAAF